MCILQPSIRAAPCRNLAHPWPYHIPLFTFGEVPGICGLVLFALECEGLRDCDDRCEIPTGSKSTLTVCRPIRPLIETRCKRESGWVMLQRVSCVILLIVLAASLAIAQQTICWKKDHVYFGPG